MMCENSSKKNIHGHNAHELKFTKVILFNMEYRLLVGGYMFFC